MSEPAPYHIRDAVAADVAALSALKVATFRETFLEGFGIPYPPVEIARFEAETYAPGPVAAELADSAHHTWVAEAADGRLVAYAHVGPVKLPHPDARPGEPELYQIYLLNEAQGQGLGGRLMKLALDWCEARAASTGGRIWLGVWSGNHRARAIYQRLGFAQVGEYHFKVGDWLDDEQIYRRDPA